MSRTPKTNWNKYNGTALSFRIPTELKELKKQIVKRAKERKMSVSALICEMIEPHFPKVRSVERKKNG